MDWLSKLSKKKVLNLYDWMNERKKKTSKKACFFLLPLLGGIRKSSRGPNIPNGIKYFLYYGIWE
jgi:hypothetical protein